MAVSAAAHQSTYEVQVYHGGRWLAVGMHQDRDDALAQAEDFGEDPRYASVKVVREHFDPERQLFLKKTVYRSAPLKKGDALKEVKEVETFHRLGSRRRELKRRESAERARRRREWRRHRETVTFACGLAARLLVISGAGLGLLYWIIAQR